MSFKPSVRQQKIFDTWVNSDKNIVVNAVAGSGKTSTLLQLLQLCKHRTLFLAFNKSIQEEIQAKMDSKGLKQGKAMTMHSLGLLSIREKYINIRINKGKNFELLKRVQTDNKEIFDKYSWKDRLALSYQLMELNNLSRMLLIDDLQEIIDNSEDMANNCFVYTKDLDKLWKSFVFHRNESYISRMIVIDFIDMLYLPVIQKLTIPVYPTYLFVDEAQDLGLLHHKLIENFINQGTIKKWVAVGDPNQSIYLFGGAYSKSFEMFIKKDNVVELPLDICYRCSSKIIDEANEVYPIMTCGVDSIGEVWEHSIDKDSPGQLDFTLRKIEPNAMVICRNTKPLVTLCFKLMNLKKHCYLLGDDIIKSIERFLKPYIKYDLRYTMALLNKEKEELEEDTTEEGSVKLATFENNYGIVVESCRNIKGVSTVEELLESFKRLFNSTHQDSICLCTVHKSKGLEADVVYFLNKELIPSKFATTEEQKAQEKNLLYVGITRAKKKLVYLSI